MISIDSISYCCLSFFFLSIVSSFLLSISKQFASKFLNLFINDKLTLLSIVNAPLLTFLDLNLLSTSLCRLSSVFICDDIVSVGCLRLFLSFEISTSLLIKISSLAASSISSTIFRFIGRLCFNDILSKISISFFPSVPFRSNALTSRSIFTLLNVLI